MTSSSHSPGSLFYWCLRNTAMPWERAIHLSFLQRNYTWSPYLSGWGKCRGWDTVLLLSPPIFIVFYVALSTNRREVAQAGRRQKDSKRCGCRKWGRGWEKRDILNSKVHRGKHFDSVSKRYYANDLIRPDKNDLRRKSSESREGGTQAYLIWLHFADPVFITN